jgi:hypothetical protein
MSRSICEHDPSARNVNHHLLASYMREGAARLAGTQFFDWDHQAQRYDTRYWTVGGRWDRNPKLKVLVPRHQSAAVAVYKIFEHPRMWTFDCSQFLQVVTFYAWLRLLGPVVFERRVRTCHFGRLEIKPFQGSVFAVPRRAYRRKKRWDWMTDAITREKSMLTVRELVDSAPVGSRVMFRNDDRAEGTAWHNENTIKVGHRVYIAHGFHPVRKIFGEEAVITLLYRQLEGEEDATYEEARDYVWVKEIDYFLK